MTLSMWFWAAGPVDARRQVREWAAAERNVAECEVISVEGADGRMRVRVDHPSNDPEIEMAMAGRSYRVVRAVFQDLGLPEPVLGPVTWRDDP